MESAKTAKTMNKNCVQSVNRQTKDTSQNSDIFYKAYFPKTNNQSTLTGCYQGTDFHHTISLGITNKFYNKIT